MKKLLICMLAVSSTLTFAQTQSLSIEKIAGMEVHKAIRTQVDFTKCLKKFEAGKSISVEYSLEDSTVSTESLYTKAECKVKLIPTNFIDQEAKEPIIEKAFYSNLHQIIANQDKTDIARFCKIKKVKITDKKLKVTFSVNKNNPEIEKGLTYDQFTDCASNTMREIQTKTDGRLSSLFLVDTMGTLFEQIQL